MGLRLFLSVCLIGITYSTGPDSEGSEFVIGFIDNVVSSNNSLKLLTTTTSNVDVLVTITTPLYDPTFASEVSVRRNEITEVQLDTGLLGSGIELSNKGIYVTATEEISLFGLNYEASSSDAFLAFPVDTLGNEYIVATWKLEAEFMIIATQNDTNISIKFPQAFSSDTINFTYLGISYTNGDTLNITMDKFQTFHMYHATGDFTGTWIVSNNPITVMSGNKNAPVVISSVKTDVTSDHMEEQLPPVDTWGKEHIAVYTPGRSDGDYYRIIASEDSTTISTLTLGNHTINAFEFKELDISSQFTYELITSDKPVMTVLFGKSKERPHSGSIEGDAHMSIIPPKQHLLSDYIWTNLKNSIIGTSTVYFTIVIEGDKETGLFYNTFSLAGFNYGNVPETNLRTVNFYIGSNTPTFNVYHEDPTVTFLIIASNIAIYSGYSYPPGRRLTRINVNCMNTATVNGDVLDNDCDGRIDEELMNYIDDDGDMAIDEDLALQPRVNGGWGDWTQWGNCSTVCDGGGTRERTRTCDNPAPAFRGFDCSGNGNESTSCIPCPVDGNWTQWSSWGDCSAVCNGTGTQERNRSCTNPAPAYNGMDCSGNDTDFTSCDGPACPIDGDWTEWSQWGACSAACNEAGTQERNRTCTNPAPAYNGTDCSGNDTEISSCNGPVCTTSYNNNEGTVPNIQVIKYMCVLLIIVVWMMV